MSGPLWYEHIPFLRVMPTAISRIILTWSILFWSSAVRPLSSRTHLLGILKNFPSIIGAGRTHRSTLPNTTQWKSKPNDRIFCLWDPFGVSLYNSRYRCSASRSISLLAAAECDTARKGLRRRVGNHVHWLYLLVGMDVLSHERDKTLMYMRL